MPPQEEPQGGEKKGGQRTASCANAGLPRVQETGWHQQTGAEGRSVGPRRRESWSRSHVGKTVGLDRKEVIRIWQKTTVRS